MKSESGSAKSMTFFKMTAAFFVAIALFAFVREHLRKADRPAASGNMNAQPAERSNADAGSAEPSDEDARPARRTSREAHTAPVKVQPFRGQYCASVGPPGWTVLDENPQRAGFGADLASSDGMAFAGYMVFPSGAMAGPGMETPGRAVAASLSAFGTISVRFSNQRQVAPNVFLFEYQSATNHGVAFYQVIPAGADGAMIVMRMGGTSTAPGLWEKRSAEAMAVARSLRCQVPTVPAAPDPPGLNSKPESARSEGEEADTLYNTWLEMEYYHNPETGENYWVNPSENYFQTGPNGAGYYATHGNSIIKLAPGYAQ